MCTTDHEHYTTPRHTSPTHDYGIEFLTKLLAIQLISNQPTDQPAQQKP